jgi:type I restriction enzyme R subunit
MNNDPTKKLKIAVIYSYAPNEEENTGILGEENSDDTSSLPQSARDFLESAIQDYNEMFQTNYDTSSEKFQNYYKDVSLRMKNKDIDLLIVVNMFLTGFDATTLNTLWVDKNLQLHGLIQAFSRTNRILNSVKTFGNIVCFRNLQKEVDTALALFGDKDARGIILARSFKDYYFGYTDDNGKYIQGYSEMIENLMDAFPVSESQIIGEQNQREFIKNFGEILRRRNILVSFDDFKGKEILTERDFQDYLGKYQDLKDEWTVRREKGEITDITNDIVFEIELIKQIEINIDYILLLVKQYHDSHCVDKEILVSIEKAVDASPELRSKKKLIQNFIADVNNFEDVITEWNKYVSEQREEELNQLIKEERLNSEETHKFIENTFRNGEVKTVGTDINKILPPMSRFGGGNRTAKKQSVIEKIQKFFEKYFGISAY